MTNEELLKMLDGDLGERAIKDCIEIGGGQKYLSKKHSYGKKISEALKGAFIWMESPEKEEFWARKFNELVNLGL